MRVCVASLYATMNYAQARLCVFTNRFICIPYQLVSFENKHVHQRCLSMMQAADYCNNPQPTISLKNGSTELTAPPISHPLLPNESVPTSNLVPTRFSTKFKHHTERD